jgi:hypothetical protein
MQKASRGSRTRDNPLPRRGHIFGARTTQVSLFTSSAASRRECRKAFGPLYVSMVDSRESRDRAIARNACCRVVIAINSKRVLE